MKVALLETAVKLNQFFFFTFWGFYFSAGLFPFMNKLSPMSRPAV